MLLHVLSGSGKAFNQVRLMKTLTHIHTHQSKKNINRYLSCRYLPDLFLKGTARIQMLLIKDATLHPFWRVCTDCSSSRESKILLIAYTEVNDLAPHYIKDSVSLYYPTRTLRSQSAGLLTTPKESTKRVAVRTVLRSPTCEQAVCLCL